MLGKDVVRLRQRVRLDVALFTAGWGMKLTPVIGQILCDLVLDGQTSYDISHFKITRPGVLKRP